MSHFTTEERENPGLFKQTTVTETVCLSQKKRTFLNVSRGIEKKLDVRPVRKNNFPTSSGALVFEHLGISKIGR